MSNRRVVALAALAGLALPAAGLAPQQAGLTDEEVAGVRAAVLAVVPDATDWSLRPHDHGWLSARREVYVDLPAPEVVDRIGWHPSLFCKLPYDSTAWSCNALDDPALELHPPPDATAGSCPVAPVRGLWLSGEVEPEVARDLVDAFRFSASGHQQATAMCGAVLERNWHPDLGLTFEGCEVKGVRGNDESLYEIHFRIADAHWAIAEIDRQCDDDGCEHELIRCRDVIA